MESKDALAELLRKLRCNKAKIPLEQLKTRYKKSYHELLVQIKNAAEIYIGEAVFQGKKAKTWATVITIRAGIAEHKFSEAISHALYCDMDITKVDDVIAQMRAYIEDMLKYEEQTFDMEKARLGKEGVDIGMIIYA